MAQTPDTAFDVIVLGVGSMGSATCYFLAQRGYRVLALDQFDIPHEWGSHSGQSRVIRKAYAEHPDYVPLLERAYQNWNALEDATGAQVYFKTGLLYFGNPADALMKGVREAAGEYSIEVNTLSQAESARKYPQFRLPSGYECLEEPDAGFVTPERCILLFADQAIRRGATILTRTKVFDWMREGASLVVSTDKGRFSCAKLIITAGPWTGKLIPDMSSRLRVTRQVIAWVTPKAWEPFELGRFPCWFVAEESKPGAYYGFPVLPVGSFGGPIGMKLARHYPGTTSDPDNVDRDGTAEDEHDLIDALNKFIPDGYSRTLAVKTCLYTNSPDEHFILDCLPGHRDVVVAAGFSGHGFKFASVVGEIMADLAMEGGTRLPIEFLSARRFGA